MQYFVKPSVLILLGPVCNESGNIWTQNQYSQTQCYSPPLPQDMPQDQFTSSTPGTEQVKFVVTPPDQNGQSDSSADTPVVERKSNTDIKETPTEDHVKPKSEEDVPLETAQNDGADDPVTDHTHNTPSLDGTTVTKQEEGVSTTIESNAPETSSDMRELKEDVPLTDTPITDEGVAGDTPPSNTPPVEEEPPKPDTPPLDGDNEDIPSTPPKPDTPPVEEEPPKPDTPPLDRDNGDIPSTPPKEDVSLPQQQLDPVEEISEGDKDPQEEPPVVVKSKPPSTPRGLTATPDKRYCR